MKLEYIAVLAQLAGLAAAKPTTQVKLSVTTDDGTPEPGYCLPALWPPGAECPKSLVRASQLPCSCESRLTYDLTDPDQVFCKPEHAQNPRDRLMVGGIGLDTLLRARFGGKWLASSQESLPRREANQASEVRGGQSLCVVPSPLLLIES